MSKLHSRLANIIAVLCITLFALMSACLICDADEEVVNYTTSKFNSVIKANNNNTVRYSESIVLNYNSPSPSFVRQLPAETIGRVSNVNVDGYDFSFDKESNSITIDLSNNEAAGTKSFSIKYTVKGNDSEQGKADFLNVYIIPDNWPTAIEKTYIRFSYDVNMEWNSIRYIVGNSSAKMTPYGDWEDDAKNSYVTFNGNNIPANTGISISAVFPEGYWLYFGNVSFLSKIAKWLFIAGIIIFIAIRIMLGKDTEISTKQCKNAPKSNMPIHIGTLVDGVTDERDISATLIEMAHRGYFNIVEYEKGKFEFVYVKFPTKESKAIKILFNSLFEGCSEYQSVKMEEVAPRFRKAASKAAKEAGKQFTGGASGFTAASSVANIILTAVYSILIFALPVLNELCITTDKTLIIERAILSIGIAFAFVVLIKQLLKFYHLRESRKGDGNAIRLKIYALIYCICSVSYSLVFRFSFNHSIGNIGVIILSLGFLIVSPLMLIGMRGRSAEASELLSMIYGLKDWIMNADKNEIKEISLENDDYFYELLPYSVILGITKKLVRDFEYVDVKFPDWYKQYGVYKGDLMNVVYLNAMINDFDSAVTKALEE